MNDNVTKLRSLLENVSDTYPDFVNGVIGDCEHHKDKNPRALEQVLEYVEKHPDANSSEIIDAELTIVGLPYGDENGKWYRWDKEITEEEAQRIADKEYNDN